MATSSGLGNTAGAGNLPPLLETISGQLEGAFEMHRAGVIEEQVRQRMGVEGVRDELTIRMPARTKLGLPMVELDNGRGQLLVLGILPSEGQGPLAIHKVAASIITNGSREPISVIPDDKGNAGYGRIYRTDARGLMAHAELGELLAAFRDVAAPEVAMS